MKSSFKSGLTVLLLHQLAQFLFGPVALKVELLVVDHGREGAGGKRMKALAIKARTTLCPPCSAGRRTFL